MTGSAADSQDRATARCRGHLPVNCAQQATEPAKDNADQGMLLAAMLGSCTRDDLTPPGWLLTRLPYVTVSYGCTAWV
jgi:hypothetical protein